MALTPSNMLPLGTAAPAFSLPATDGNIVSLEDFHQSPLLLVSFICNHCPYVIKIAEEFSKLASETQDSVNWIAISANDPDYRAEDSPENMSKFAAKYNFNFPYLFDGSQEVARTFGAVCTPDIFVYKHSKLAYHARFEDLARAIKDLQTSDHISFEDLPSAGCSIKWK